MYAVEVCVPAVDERQCIIIKIDACQIHVLTIMFFPISCLVVKSCR